MLKDLNSTNGLFVRVSQAVLSDGQELLLGGRRYCFRNATGEPAPQTNAKRGTVVVGRASSDSPSATLEEVVAEGNAACIPLGASEQWLGRDPARCDIALDDPMLDAQEAKIYQNDKSQWFIKSGKSLNGVWIRVEETLVSDRGARFQCGEQRFELRFR